MAKNYNQALQLNNADLQAILNVINELPEANNGVELPTLTNEGSASELLSGKELIDGEGNIVTGTMPNNGAISSTMDGINTKSITIPSGYTSGGSVSLDNTIDNEVTTQENLITQIMTVIDELPEASTGGGDTSLEDGLVAGTLTDYTNDRVTSIGIGVFAQVENLKTVNFPAVTSIDKNAFNRCPKLTTANFPKATSIGYYAFSACSSLTEINFPEVVTIDNYTFAVCSKLTTVSFPKLTSMGYCAFSTCNKLTTVDFPELLSTNTSAFYNCTNLTTVSFPKLLTIGYDAFANCSKLTSISFPVATCIEGSAFRGCTNLTTVSLPAVISIGTNAFQRCYNLTSLYLSGSSVCNLSNSNAFTSTPIGGYSASAGTYGSIFVPASLVDAYKTASNWSYFADRITAFVE